MCNIYTSLLLYLLAFVLLIWCLCKFHNQAKIFFKSEGLPIVTHLLSALLFLTAFVLLAAFLVHNWESFDVKTGYVGLGFFILLLLSPLLIKYDNIILGFKNGLTTAFSSNAPMGLKVEEQNKTEKDAFAEEKKAEIALEAGKKPLKTTFEEYREEFKKIEKKFLKIIIKTKKLLKRTPSSSLSMKTPLKIFRICCLTLRITAANSIFS